MESWNYRHSLKLYGFREKKLVSLSLLRSATEVVTFYIEQTDFEQILASYNSREGANVGPFLIHQKGPYIRFTHRATGGPEINHRVATEKWTQLVSDYRAKMAVGTEPYITCIVD